MSKCLSFLVRSVINVLFYFCLFSRTKQQNYLKYLRNEKFQGTLVNLGIMYWQVGKYTQKVTNPPHKNITLCTFWNLWLVEEFGTILQACNHECLEDEPRKMHLVINEHNYTYMKNLPIGVVKHGENKTTKPSTYLCFQIYKMFQET